MQVVFALCAVRTVISRSQKCMSSSTALTIEAIRTERMPARLSALSKRGHSASKSAVLVATLKRFDSLSVSTHIF